MRNYHRLHGFQQKSILQSWMPAVQHQGVGRVGSFRRLCGRSHSMPLSWLRGVLVCTHLCTLCSAFTPPSPFSVCLPAWQVCLSFLSGGTQSQDLGPTRLQICKYLIQGDLQIPDLITSTMTLQWYLLVLVANLSQHS